MVTVYSLADASSVHPLGSLPDLPRRRRRLDPIFLTQLAQTLAPTELELFQHYLEHTSRDLTVGDEDQYTLQVGIPILAGQSRPLMQSVLALAAVCQCCDVISRSSTSQGDRGQVLGLLSLAQQYHTESLRETRATLPKAKHYDHVLANAAMMGMYGSGSYRIRIWLAKTASSGDQPLGSLVPRHLQWISLFRAVHLAYFGLLSARARSEDTRRDKPPHLIDSSLGGGGSQMHTQPVYEMSARIKQPTPTADHVLFPILAATVGTALEKLHRKARQIAVAQESNETAGRSIPKMSVATSDPGMQACLSTLAILSNIAKEAFLSDNSVTGATGHSALDVDIDPVGQLSEVSPWMRRYAARITSRMPSKLPRRIIMAFVHRVPTRYLSLVEEVISWMWPGTDNADPDFSMSMLPEPSVAHQLAVDIFAHWLVLVILLDDVWWIGGLGAWELKRIVSLRKDVRWRACLWNRDEDWWPESMLEVSWQLDKHRAKGRASSYPGI